MTQHVPPHMENAETFATEPVQVFESEASPEPLRKKARPRPPGRPRIVPLEEPSAWLPQVFECQGIPAPPGTRAKPRPPGRERGQFDQAASAALPPDQTGGSSEAPVTRLVNR